MLSTNKPFGELAQVFPNAACVVTLVDRFLHRAEIIDIEGESYRLKARGFSRSGARPSRATFSLTPAGGRCLPRWLRSLVRFAINAGGAALGVDEKTGKALLEDGVATTERRRAWPSHQSTV